MFAGARTDKTGALLFRQAIDGVQIARHLILTARCDPAGSIKHHVPIPGIKG
jgi:hypothetical protein